MPEDDAGKSELSEENPFRDYYDLPHRTQWSSLPKPDFANIWEEAYRKGQQNPSPETIQSIRQKTLEDVGEKFWFEVTENWAKWYATTLDSAPELTKKYNCDDPRLLVAFNIVDNLIDNLREGGD